MEAPSIEIEYQPEATEKCFTLSMDASTLHMLRRALIVAASSYALGNPHLAEGPRLNETIREIEVAIALSYPRRK